MSQTMTLTYGCDGATTVSVSHTAGTRLSMNEAFAASNDQLFALTLDVSQAKAIFIYSDVAATLETNNSSAPAATVTLVAGQPVVWSSTNGQTNPFGSTDITALYVSAASTGTLTLEILVDPTV